MKKRRLVLSIGVLCLLAVGVIFVYRNHNIDKSDIETVDDKNVEDPEEEARLSEVNIAEARAEWMRENGGMPDSTGEAYAIGKTIQISKEEYEYSLVKYKVEENEEPMEESIIRSWARAKILYNLAIEKGYFVTDEEVMQLIQNAKENNKLYEEKYGIKSPLSAEMEGFETEDEYWESVFTFYERDAVIDKYISDLKDQKAAEWGLQDSYFELEEKWGEYYEEYVDQLVAEEEIKIL